MLQTVSRFGISSVTMEWDGFQSMIPKRHDTVFFKDNFFLLPKRHDTVLKNNYSGTTVSRFGISSVTMEWDSFQSMIPKRHDKVFFKDNFFLVDWLGLMCMLD